MHTYPFGKLVCLFICLIGVLILSLFIYTIPTNHVSSIDLCSFVSFCCCSFLFFAVVFIWRWGVEISEQKSINILKKYWFYSIEFEFRNGLLLRSFSPRVSLCLSLSEFLAHYLSASHCLFHNLIDQMSDAFMYKQHIHILSLSLALSHSHTFGFFIPYSVVKNFRTCYNKMENK